MRRQRASFRARQRYWWQYYRVTVVCWYWRTVRKAIVLLYALEWPFVAVLRFGVRHPGTVPWWLARFAAFMLNLDLPNA